MVVRYELQVHSRDVLTSSEYDKHTGYDLIKYVDDMPVQIQSIDLYNHNGNIKYDIRTQVVAQDLYESTGDVVGSFMFYDGTSVPVTAEWLTDMQYCVSEPLLINDSAVQAFNKIKLEATILNHLTNNLSYNIVWRNCNTSTNYFAQQYVNGQNVFATLPIGEYIGSDSSFYDPNSNSTTDVTIKAVRNVIDKYYSLVGSNVDLSNVQYGVVNQSNAWYAKFTTNDYNYVFVGNGNTNIVDIYGDSFIYASSGNNTINAGNGNDVIYGRTANIINGGDGDDIIYAGDQTYASHVVNGGSGDDIIYAGHGGDDITGGNGQNIVFLGRGSDKYTGGDGVDIVDGGSQDFTFTDSADSSFEYVVSADLSGDINTIKLGGGSDVYKGGIGKDIVDGGAGDDKIFAGDGNNEITGGSGHDIIETGSGNDIIHAGTGRDVIRAGGGINHIYLGNDDMSDDVWLSNSSGGIDHIYQITSNDVIHYNSNVIQTEYSGRDVIETLANGAKVILHDFYDEDPGDFDENNFPAAGSKGAPLIVLPDGSVWGYGSDGRGYRDTGYKLPGEFPGEDGVTGARPQPGAGEDIPLDPPVANPEDPTDEGGDTPEDNPDGQEDGLKGTGDQPLSQDDIDKGIKGTAEGLSNLYEERQRLLRELLRRLAIAREIGDINITAEETKSPLIVDLDGDGVETTTVDDGVYFDHDGNNFAEKTAWVGKDDGLLVRDINGNGKIDDGSELFGNNTILSNGQKAANGFEALKDLDSNGDGVFNSSDAAWNEVRVWKDKNGNGYLEAGELFSLNNLGIDKINLNYQNVGNVDENGNTIGQTGSFIKTDGTSGMVSDIWFNTDLMNTVDKIQIEIPEDILALPNVIGFGNVHDLHTAMALDATGELKNLVQQYAAETNLETRQQILCNLIYHWTGVQNMDPRGRDPKQIYGPVLDDCRKLEALEEFMGEEFLGTWCWGERDPNPHGKAAPYILRAFELLEEYINNELLAQTHYKPLLENVKLLWNETTQSWDIDVNSAVALIQETYNADADQGIAIFREFENLVKNCGYNNLLAIYDAFRLSGDENGNDLEMMISKFGLTYGTEWDDKLTGGSGVDDIQGLGGNDRIYAGAGNDTLDGGDGNDNLFGEDGDDILIGGAGNDYLIGGNGADTYIFNPGFGHDAIDNSDNNASNSEPDIVQFGEGISPDKVSLGRQGYDLIITVSYEPDENGNKLPDDSVRIYSYFDEQGESSATVNSIVFADGTSWDYEYVLAHWNSVPGVNGGVTLEGNNDANVINGTQYNDILIGNGGNDTINAGDGDDTIIGGTGDDTLNGGVGRDTYIYNLGDSADTINETRGNDIIKFGEGISQSDLTFTQEGNNLKIWIGNDPYQSILINNFYTSVNNQVEKLQFADGSTFNLSTQGLTLTQNNSDETINGTGYNDVIYGNGGHDTINANDGNDTLIGGIGNDTLNGGGGNDTYIYNLGDGFDTINETGGNDKIVFGKGINLDNLSFERIDNNLKISINGNEIKGIQINNQFSSESYRVETIEFYDGSTLDISNADQLIQAMNSFSLSNSASTDTLSNPTQDVSDMYGLAANSGLNNKAV